MQGPARHALASGEDQREAEETQSSDLDSEDEAILDL